MTSYTEIDCITSVTYNLNKLEYFGRKVPKKINYEGIEIFVIDLIQKEKQDKNNIENTQNAV